METTNNIQWVISKTYSKRGQKYRIKVKISLNDECKNGHEDFAITADIDEYTRNGRWIDYMGGCCHDEILEQYPELKMFVDLHLSDATGAPMYAIENSLFHLKDKGVKTFKNYLRLTDEEAEKLKDAEDKNHLYILCESIGLFDRWQKEANEAIAWLEEKTGKKFKSSATRSNLKRPTDEEIKLTKERLANGYFSPENIEERAKQKREEAKQKLIDSINEDCEKTCKKARTERDIQLAFVAVGIEPKKYIYYNHSNTIKFNWNASNYNKAIPKEAIIKAIELVDQSMLPKDIIFEY